MDLDDAYANAKYIPNADEFIERWQEDARNWREMENAAGRLRVNIPYGENPREAFDLFLPAGRPEGLIVFVHGGYWLRFDKFFWSHFAAGGTERGWAVAMPSYPLAPEVHISDITKSVRAAIELAAEKVLGPIVLAGHSAGGHLVARMLGPDGLSDAVASRIQTVVPISPLSDLRPLMQTEMNEKLCLDEAEAISESPMLHPKALDVPVKVWVGADERPVFVEQAKWLGEAWPDTTVHIEKNLHHFDIIDGLRDAQSPLMNALLGEPRD
ncbi:alpha/beta hydrolase [Falsihalocynthiibacter sp. SS001]|uniref:alpha/beta hydrolase n=1 Tax=Falsihalocynthiibacter sp. SS001 TaxID=3349698 RepID=UPI0036D319BF